MPADRMLPPKGGIMKCGLGTPARRLLAEPLIATGDAGGEGATETDSLVALVVTGSPPVAENTMT